MTRSIAELYDAIADLRVRQAQLRARLDLLEEELDDVVWALADERGERIQALERENARLRSRLAGRGLRSDLELRYPEARVRPDRQCVVCGGPTDTPPECGTCAVAEETAAKRRSDA